MYFFSSTLAGASQVSLSFFLCVCLLFDYLEGYSLNRRSSPQVASDIGDPRHEQSLKCRLLFPALRVSSSNTISNFISLPSRL